MFTDEGFVEALPELWRASTGRNKLQVPRFDKVTTLLHCKKNYTLNSVIIDLNYNFSNPPSEMRHQST